MRNDRNEIRYQLSRHQFSLRGWHLIVAAALGCAASGCEDFVAYTHIGAPSPALVARPVESVEVFLGTPPSRPHRNLGVFQVARGTFSSDRSMNDTVQVARANAAALGCEAILVTSVDVFGGRYRPANVQANCIVYTAPPVSEPPSAPCPAQAPIAAGGAGEATAPGAGPLRR